MPKYAETWLTSDTPGPAYFEPLEIVPNSNQGFNVPKPAEKFVSWLVEEKPINTILELAERGRLVAHPWEKYDLHLSDLVVQQQSTLGETDDLSARMILLAIGERFIRGSINKNNYLALNNRIIFHMNFSLGKKTRVMFIALANTFEIWTEQFYEEIKPQLSSPITERCTNLVPL